MIPKTYKPYNGPLIHPVPVRIPAFEERLTELIRGMGYGGKMTIERQAGICCNTILRYMQGKHFPSLAVAQTLAEMFHVSLDWLTGRTDDRKGGLPHDADD